MTHTYTITGMTCNNCKASVEKALLSLDNVEKIFINIENSIMIIMADVMLLNTYN